ncbi:MULTISPECIES: glycosyltransferase family protein [Streptomycetaceae]|uniref:Integral membrane protein n=1 Tax=Streptantibioticus cattleyicolor (strain ATCC 35852 / DSM 46488 / JCM 4925 / NBRC 14057 / NRRL 8057) TaxID=1003195 RepID=F8K550_STREN|nr:MULTISPECIES: membrane protein [Streptomycetaceae]AEW96601.1 integral membrane protein [Streptantibioticus cattleyicolor NRRL 8057 = DSM 46488]MYS61097.1 hypothetical protein [Streptomyces sp. SID5468]CCB76939.1 putative Integral membrane protein [Streptantibioticus cattleyicolor NRRL 8057 = DSM 46488]
MADAVPPSGNPAGGGGAGATAALPPGATAGTPRPAGRGAALRRTARRLRREPFTVTFVPREAALAALVHLLITAVGFTVLLLVCHHLGYPAERVLRKWDSKNYLAIAEHGYEHRLRYLPDGVPAWNTLAFFPLVPALISAVHTVLGIGYPYAGVVVSWLAGTVAATGVYTLARSLAGRRAGYACAALWACSPYAFALWVPYSEAVFSAALMWALVALAGRRWVAAGVLTVVAGTVRPTASVLVGTVALTALWALVRGRDDSPAPRGYPLRPWAALLLCPLGLVFSWLYLGSRIGRLDGWFEAERAWGQSFDFGVGTLRFVRMAVTGGHFDPRYPVVVGLLVVVLAGAAVLALDRRVPWALVLALAGAWALMFGTPGSPLSKPRFMLPFLPLLLLTVVRGFARLPVAVQGCVYAAGAVFAGWYGAELLMVLRWSP